MASGFGKLRLFDDFLGDTYDSNLWSVPVAGSGVAPAINVQTNGVVRNTVTNNSSSDLSSLVGEVIYKASAGGPLVFEARCAIATSLSQCIFIGLTGTKPSTTGIATDMPIETNGGTLVTPHADALGFTYTGGSGGAAVWQASGTKANVDTALHSAAARFNPVLATFQTFRIVVFADGSASFYIDGEPIKENLASAVTASTLLCPVTCITDDGAAGSLDTDYVYVSCGRS